MSMKTMVLRGLFLTVMGLVCLTGVRLAFADGMMVITELKNEIVRQIHEDAIVAHGDSAKARDYFLEKYLSTLPQEEDSGETFYFVESCIRLSREGVRRYLEDLAGGGQASDKPGELLVNIHNDEFDYWKNPADRRLTYAVDYDSFRNRKEAEMTAKDLQEAAEDWMATCPECGIEFVHLSPEEAGEDFENARFVLRFRNNPNGPIARAFFPHQSNPDLVVYPAYFSTSFDRVGVMRHELGHTLGYRHEHTRGIPGCRFEDFQWVPLTSYDPTSVMHYFCGGGGTFELKLSEQDKKGHRCLYVDGAPCPREE